MNKITQQLIAQLYMGFKNTIIVTALQNRVKNKRLIGMETEKRIENED